MSKRRTLEIKNFWHQCLNHCSSLLRPLLPWSYREWRTSGELFREYQTNGEGWVVDVGVGRGEFWNYVGYLPHYWIGVEERLCALGEPSRFNTRLKGRGEFRFLLADALHLPFKPQSLERLIVLGLAEYLPSLIPALMEWRATLREGGILILSSSPPIFSNRVRGLLWGGLRLYSDQEVESSAREAGWGIAARRRAGWQSLWVFTS